MSAAQNPWNQLLTKKRLRNKGSLSGLQQRLWYCLSAALCGLDDAMLGDDAEQVQKWLASITQLSHAYSKVAIDGDIETRLKAVEQAMLQSQEPDASGPYSPARGKR